MTIKAPHNYGISAYVKRIKMRKLYSYEDSLEVISDNNMTSFKWFGNNEEVMPKVSLVSSANNGEIYVLFKSNNFAFSLHNKGFKIVLTTFTRKQLILHIILAYVHGYRTEMCNGVRGSDRTPVIENFVNHSCHLAASPALAKF